MDEGNNFFLLKTVFESNMLLQMTINEITFQCNIQKNKKSSVEYFYSQLYLNTYSFE